MTWKPTLPLKGQLPHRYQTDNANALSNIVTELPYRNDIRDCRLHLHAVRIHSIASEFLNSH